MRLPLRWNLIASIGIPLTAAFAAVFVVDYLYLTALTRERTEARLTELASTEAVRLGGELLTIAQVVHSTAAVLEATAEPDQQQVEAMLTSDVGMHAMIFGAAVAFASDPADPGRLGAAPYVHRDGKELRHMDIGRDAYDFTQKAWYTRPLEEGKGVWIEPFFDKGAGDALMCTYARPFHREGQLRGVVKVDVLLEDLQMQISGGGFEDQVVSIISRQGNFIVHPHSKFIMKSSMFEMANATGRADLADLAHLMTSGRRGACTATDFPGPGQHLVFYAPIPVTGWSFVAAAPEASVMAAVYSQMRTRTALLFVGFVCFLTILYVISTHIARPVQSLAGAVAKLAKGDLSVRVPPMKNNDELGDLANAFNQMVRDLNGHVEALARETAERERVESELRVARMIQASLLPQTFPPFPERHEFDLSAVNIPARQVAGDFFDYFFVDKDVLTLVVGDVSGKGMPAALLMAVSRTIIRDLASTGMGPAEVLKHANARLLVNNERSLFLTLWLGQYNTRTGDLTYANGGHPPPYRLSATGEVDIFGDVTAPLLGIVDEPTFEAMNGEQRLQVAPGETLLVYTDGIPEAISPEGEFFELKRFERLLSDLAGEAVGMLCDRTIEETDTFQDRHSSDDRTLLALRRVS